MARSIRVKSPPEGFLYRADFVTKDEESDLIQVIETLPLKNYEFYEFEAKRRTISFGWHYNFAEGSLKKADIIPDFLQSLREKAANFAQLAAVDLPHVLVTEYSPGTPIGWHRDRPVFEDVIGISLLSSCPFRLRRKFDVGFERFTQMVEPRSAYMLRGPARDLWEHSIPPVEQLRYSITFRSLRNKRRPF